MTSTLNSIQVRKPAAAGRDSLRFAAIDVGSNSVHMIVAQVDPDGAVTTLWRMKEMVGLGRMSFPSRKLSRDAMDNAIAALGRFAEAAKQRGAEKVVAVATSAVREAENGGDFILEAKRLLGLHVRTISAREEARLIYLAVRHAMDLEKPHLIIDIGGGSVEFIVGDKQSASMLESRKLGASRMTAEFVRSDPLKDGERCQILAHFDKVLTPLCEQIRSKAPIKAIGTSGTLECLAAMTSDDADAPPQFIDRDALAKLIPKLLESDSAKRSQFKGLADQRRDQITAGALLVHEIFNRLDLKRIELCGSALREGILLDYLHRHAPELKVLREVPDPRRRSVIDLARRCHWHQTHSEHVASLCLSLFDQTKPIHKLGPIERELIEYAALLHDIGWHIGRPKHHKHSAYLIRHGELKGFSNEEVEVIANIARYHRKSTPSKSHRSYAQLSARHRHVVDVGTALLRMADGLDRSHVGSVVKVSCKIGEHRVRCLLTPRSDAAMELWGAKRKMKFFRHVFGRKISFELEKR